MFNTRQKSFDWFSLVVGILFVIAEIASFMHPDKTLHFLSILVEIFFILRGIYELWFRKFIGASLNESSGWFIFAAVLDIVLGVIVLVAPNWGILYLAILFAIWFIIDAIMRIKAAKFFQAFNRGYATWLVILGVLSIILGVILFFSPMLSALTIVWLVSVVLLVFGITHIIQAFQNLGSWLSLIITVKQKSGKKPSRFLPLFVFTSLTSQYRSGCHFHRQPEALASQGLEHHFHIGP